VFKYLLIPFLVFSSLTGASAQATAPTAPTSKPTSSDTIQAVHQVFSKHRTGGWIWTGIGAAFAARILVAGASDDNASGTLVGTAVFGGVPAGVGIGKLTRFSEAKEELAVADYQKNKRLPNYVQRRLKRKYFTR
jgi:hypothetical protein